MNMAQGHRDTSECDKLLDILSIALCIGSTVTWVPLSTISVRPNEWKMTECDECYFLHS